MNDVYLVARILLVVLPAVLLAYGRGRMSLWVALACFAGAAPFVGFAYSNPPLVGIIGLTTTATPLLAWARFGRPTARRALRLVMLGGAILFAVSAYWLVPDVVALGAVAFGKLSGLSAWGFTEARATLANALWLNTSWGWRFTAYYPYAPDFARFPLGLVQVLLPLLAFSGLCLRTPNRPAGWRVTRLRGAVAIGTLVIVFFSTGTRAPGNLLFDPLYYHLPYGWLLREPGRFLIFASLGYALLAALLVEQWRHFAPTQFSSKNLVTTAMTSTLGPPGLALSAVALLALASGFPLWTGAVVPTQRQAFPPDHVKVPAYWLATAHYLNTSGPPGSLLVLPPDDFYQMPYRWYYGSDQFISNLVDRNVLDPSAQSYQTVSENLLDSVRLESSALLAHDWKEANKLLQVLGTPLVLVRGDIVSDFYHRKIPSPASLAMSLSMDPGMRILHTDGLLKVFVSRKIPSRQTDFATVDTSSPDLRVLSILPTGTSLVTAVPRPGHLSVLQLPPVATWNIGATEVTTTVPERGDWKYSAVALGLQGSATDTGLHLSQNQVTSREGRRALQIRLPLGALLIHDGTFSAGPWGPVGNCFDHEPVISPEFLRADVLPRAGPRHTRALQLTASIDAACESTELTWNGGPILLSLWVRSVSGAPPEMCIRESPINRCAVAAPLPQGSKWHLYRTTVFPDEGTQSITIFLYAYAESSGPSSIEEFSRVIARSLTHSPRVDVLGRPTTSAGATRLLASSVGYAPGWTGPAGALHVLVDGVRNGWLTRSRTATLRNVWYQPIANELRNELSLASGLLLFVLVGVVIWRRKP